MSMLELARERVLAHRAVVHDLARPAHDALACQVVGVGLQDTPVGSALMGLAVRTDQAAPAVAALLDDGGPFTLVLAARGAPHLVSRAALPLVTAALYPVDPREAAEVDEVAQAMREVANGTAISRPALSGALNDKVADSLRAWCERCRSRHVREELFRRASLHAGLELDPSGGQTTMFRPSGAPSPSGSDHERARAELTRRFVHATGVARPADLASWLGRTAGAVRPTWDLVAPELTPCRVDGLRRWALTTDVESLSRRRRPGATHLLPPSDPFLLGDRSLVVPSREHQRRLWRPVGSPGAVLVDGEIVGTWRHRTNGGRFEVGVRPFGRLDAAVTKDLTRVGERLAALRDASDARIDVITPD